MAHISKCERISFTTWNRDTERAGLIARHVLSLSAV